FQIHAKLGGKLRGNLAIVAFDAFQQRVIACGEPSLAWLERLNSCTRAMNQSHIFDKEGFDGSLIAPTRPLDQFFVVQLCHRSQRREFVVAVAFGGGKEVVRRGSRRRKKEGDQK